MMRERGTTIRLPEELQAEARRAAGAHGSFNKFVAWAIRQALRLEFLSAGNREFVLRITSELGRPWDVLAVLNLLAGYARGDARARKLVDLFFTRNDSLRVNEAHGEPPEIPVEQAAIDFSQGEATAAGEASPSPKKCEPSPAHPGLSQTGTRRGGARG